MTHPTKDDYARDVEYFLPKTAPEMRGVWVKNADLPNWVNIAGRKFRTVSGKEGYFDGRNLQSENIAEWFFPAEPIRPQEDEPRAGCNAATWMIGCAALTLGIIIGWATMADTPAPEMGPGFEMCEWSC